MNHVLAFRFVIALVAFLLSWSFLALAAEDQPRVWQLHAGQPLAQQLEDWSETAGWMLYWRPAVTWRVVADTTFSGSFDEALASVIDTLYQEGKPVRLVLWEGNRVAEVLSDEVR